MWIDSATAEVVRLTFRYLGTSLWVTPEKPTRSDSAEARRINAFANQLVSIDADLEYSLQDGRYWMPYRQVIAGRVRVPMVSDLVIPFQATTTFDDFEINTGRPLTFAVALPEQPPHRRRCERHDGTRSRRSAREAWLGSGGRRGRLDLRRSLAWRSLRAASPVRRFAGPIRRLAGFALLLEGDPAEAARIRETETSLAYLAERLARLRHRGARRTGSPTSG